MIDASIKQFEETERGKWSYKVVRMESEEGDVTSSTEVFTPHEDKLNRWTLLELNGQQANKAQQDAFVRNKVASSESNQNPDSNIKVKLREIIDLETLSFVSENHTHIELAFNVHIEKLGDDAIGKLDGLLTFDKQNHYIDTIRVTNNEEFSPMFSAAISDFKLTLKFTELEDAILPVEASMEMKGSFAFFTEINEVSTDRYSQYVYHGQVEQK